MTILREANRSDLDGILEIFNHEIRTSTNAWHTEPIEGDERDRWFSEHEAREYPLLTAVADGVVLGWASLSPWSHHGAYKRTAELSIFIDQNQRGRGLGKQLLERLIAEAVERGHHVLIARVEASNVASRTLHLRAGFRSVGIMHEVGFKFGRFLDAELFERLL